ncbi:glycosyltransferase family 4 protein [Oceanobacillus oncorhynchi subsp. oncorhynchi]|uniref:glycosyltransferase family 4 protein n=1 Tax=Oceanobacillus oncorhynchi TaxID=545501 RepID=UPI00362BE1BF
MKITYISASIIPSEKANSVNVMKMSNAFSEIGHEVTLVGTKGKDYNQDIFDNYDVKNSFNLKLSKRGKLSSIYRLLTGIRESKNADIVYTRWITSAAFLILFTNRNLIYEYHAPHNKRLSKKLESLIVKSKKVKRHIFITKALKDYYVEKYDILKDKDLKVLPDAADLVSDVDMKKLPHEYDCIYVGSFQKGKGVNLVIEIANRLPDTKFAIVGGTKDEVKEKKQEELNGNITWLGHLPHQKANEVLQKAKIALLPNQPKVLIGSQDIGKWTSPMKLFEYMANKKAIIASDIDVLKEILIDEKNCILVKHNDYEAWVHAIKRVLDDKELLDSIALEGYQNLRDKYTWNSRAQQALEGLN